MNELTPQWFIPLVEGQVYLTIRGDQTETKPTELTHAELMSQFDQEFTHLIETSPATFVHLIIDTRGIRHFPSLTQTRTVKYPYHPRMGYNVTIGAFRDPLMSFIIGMTLSITRMRYRDVHTLSEACTFLAEKDPSLPPLHTWNIPSHIDASAS